MGDRAVILATRLRDFQPLLQRLGRLTGEHVGDASLFTDAADELMRLHSEESTARAEGARRERERIRVRTANDTIALAVSRYATRGTDTDWSALLAAITEG